MDPEKLNKLKKKCEKRGHHFWRANGKNLPGDNIFTCDHCKLVMLDRNTRRKNK